MRTMSSEKQGIIHNSEFKIWFGIYGLTLPFFHFYRINMNLSFLFNPYKAFLKKNFSNQTRIL